MLTGSPTVAASLLAEQAQVLEQIVRGAPLPTVLAALCRIVESHAGEPVRAAILLTENDTHLRTGAAPSLPDSYNRAIDGIAIAADVGTCCTAAATCQVVVTPDIESAPAWAGLRHLPLGLGLVAAWSMPIVSSTQRVLGTFGTYFLEKREPRPHERELVEVLARTAALAIERDRADHALRETARRQQFLADLGTAVQGLADSTEMMETTAKLLAEYLGVDRCAYANVEDERVFVITGDHSRGVPSIVGNWELAAFGPACVDAMCRGVPYVVDDVAADPRIAPDFRAAYAATTIAAVVCVPLHKDGRLTAAMAVHQKVPRTWTSAEVELVTLVVARCWEVLERMRVTRDLRESESRYRTMVQATPECVKVVAPDGTLLQMNAAGLRMIEATEAIAIGASVYDVIAPEHRERFREFNEHVCAGHDGVFEFDLISAGGTRRSMESTAVALPSPSGGFVQLAITRDVSARVNADRALAESRARLDYAVRLSGVGFWYCDLPFGGSQIWDARCKEHFFLPPDANGTLELFFDRMHPEDRERTREAIKASIADHSAYDVVYRVVDPSSGAIKHIRALGGAAYAADGTPVRFDGVTVDMTQQKLSEERLAQVANQLREQDRAKDAFLATLAHELRNPLAPISTGLEVLQAGTDRPARILEMMHRQLGHLVRLVDDLLDISRVTLGKVDLKKSRVDLRTVIDSAIETTRPLVESARHEITVELPSSPLLLDVDPTRLSQVFANLINNAAKYTPHGGRIEISATTSGGTLAVHVTDTGVGIPREMLPRVFDMFTQVGRSIDRSQGGLGIGLTLVRRLVEMHGGTVESESAGLNQGSRFTVRLPLVSTAELGPGSAAEPVLAPGQLKVLVVDDNVDAAEMLTMLLEISGNQTRIAHSGEEALTAVTEFQPDVVFLDIGLPEMNGYEVAARMRADASLRQPVIVALTGWGSDEDRRQAHEAGFDKHLVKPIDSRKLDAVLASARA